MYDQGHDLLDALRAAPDIYRTLLAGVSDEQARSARGGDEGWSVIEVLCHLRDAEERAVERVRAMRTEDNPFIASYDQDAWAVERNYAGESLDAALEAFLRFKQAHIAELEALPPGGFERTGRHEEMGQINILGHTIHMASHDAIHAAQIARQLAR